MTQLEEPGNLCHFLDKAPPEVRNRIYAELFPDSATVMPQLRSYQFPAILQTCRQIRNEASTMYYASTVFRFDSRVALIKWLRALSIPHLGALTDVQFSDDSLERLWHGVSRHDGVRKRPLLSILRRHYWDSFGEVRGDIRSLAADGITLKDDVLKVMVMDTDTDTSYTRNLRKVAIQ